MPLDIQLNCIYLICFSSQLKLHVSESILLYPTEV